MADDQPTNGKSPEKKKTKKAPALYHLFHANTKGSLQPVGDVSALSAELAVGVFVDKPPKEHAELAEKVKTGAAQLVVVPDRNYTVIGAQEEVKRTLKIKALNKS
jgi:hypothetical protein